MESVTLTTILQRTRQLNTHPESAVWTANSIECLAVTSVILFTVFSVNPIQSAGILFVEYFIFISVVWVYRLRITASFKKTIPDKPVENDPRRLIRDHVYYHEQLTGKCVMYLLLPDLFCCVVFVLQQAVFRVHVPLLPFRIVGTCLLRAFLIARYRARVQRTFNFQLIIFRFWDFRIWTGGQNEVVRCHFLINVYADNKCRPNKNCFHQHTSSHNENYVSPSPLFMFACC